MTESQTTGAPPRYSVVIVTYNSGQDIGACLSSIEKNTRGHEVVVVDNASRDDTRKILKKFPDVKTILNPDNRGFTAACNQGVLATTGTYVLFLNPDTQVFPLWADRMADKFRLVKNCGAVGPLSTNCISYQSIYNLYPQWQDLPPAQMAENVLKNADQYYETNVLIGFCLMVPREVLLHAGLFDERLFLGNDDIEYSWRLRSLGYRLIIAKDAFIAHELQKSFNTEPKAKTAALVQQSADELYRKLARRYGKANVPSGEQLWGISWFAPSEAVKAEDIRGPERPLKILMNYNRSPDTLPARFEPALREFCELTTVGHSSDPSSLMDIPLADRTDDVVDAVKAAGGFERYDLFLWFESSNFTVSPKVSSIPIPTTAVFSASSINFELHRRLLPLFDHCLFTEYGVYRHFRIAGERHVGHLYTNAYDDREPLPAGEPLFDVSFAGSYMDQIYPSRGRLLKTLVRLSERRKVYLGNGLYGRDYQELIAASRIVVNAPADGLKGFTMRSYEAMGQGALLLTSDPVDLCPLQEFQEGVHYVRYEDERDLERKIDHYLAHPEESKIITTAASEAVRRRHTYKAAALRLTAHLREFLSEKPPRPERLVAVPVPGAFAPVHLLCGSPELALETLESRDSRTPEREALLRARLSRVDEALARLRGLGDSLAKTGRYSLAVLLTGKGEFAEARKWFEKSLEVPLDTFEDLFFVLPGGLSLEKLMAIRAGILAYSGPGDLAALAFAEARLNDCARFRLAHLALRENDPGRAGPLFEAIDWEAFRHGSAWMLRAQWHAVAGRYAEAGQCLDKGISLSPLDPQNGLMAAEILERAGKKERAVSALLEGLDGLQAIVRINPFGRNDYEAPVCESIAMLRILGLAAPEPGDLFKQGLLPPVAASALRRYAAGLDPSTAEAMDLNRCPNPGEWLAELRREKREARFRFRNAQSLTFLENLTQDRAEALWPPEQGAGVREYTWVTVENLLSRNGFEVSQVSPEPVRGGKERLRDEELVRAGRLVLRRLEYTDDEWDRFFVEAFEVRAKLREPVDVSAKKVSIVILTFNQLDYTRQCIESLVTYTPPQAYEIIVVDNASTDGTPAWLESEKKAGRIARVILNPENRGVAGGWNQGLREASGDYVLILNNDIVATKGWLAAMVRCAESDPRIGMVGPMTNSISGLQKEPSANYTTLRELHAWAADYAARNAGNWWDLFRIVGFAMLVRREAVKKVGEFDERFGKGNFEDDDYCIRVRRAGYRVVVAGDSFIHHFGGVSFAGSTVNWHDQMQKNQRLFSEKWEQIDREIIEKRTRSAPAGLIAEAERKIADKDYAPAIHLLMAAVEKDPKNPAVYNNLGVVAWAKGNTADAEHFFVEALRHDPAFEDALFNLADAHLLRGARDRLRPLLTGFLARVPGHEEAKKRLAALDAPPPESGIKTFGQDLQKEAEAFIEQGLYDEAVGRLSVVVEADPDSAAAYSGLGLCAWYKGKNEEAYWLFRKAAVLAPGDPDILFNFTDAALVLGRAEEALAALEQGVALNPGHRELSALRERVRLETRRETPDFSRVIAARELNREAEKLISEGLYDRALPLFQEILKGDPDNFTAVNNLGLIHWYRGDIETAFSSFRQALTLSPVYEDALVNGFDAALRLRRIPEMVPLLEHALHDNPGLREAREILAQIRLRGEKIYEIAHYGQIDTSLALNLEGRKLLDDMKVNEATLKFLDAIEKNGDNSDSYCGLGVIQFYRGAFEDAWKLFMRAVELNPLSQDALLNLYDAGLKLSAAELARPWLEHALEVDPTLSDVRRVLQEGLEPGQLP